ncbi:MAG: hypothetical protein NWF01_08130 [Candidatus Bathyarchaeota archaeon]|nr:hypothetical protein [Candidatus Bathyarchaeota archaeon]
MKKQYILITTLILLLIATQAQGLASTTQTITNAGTINNSQPTTTQIGLNYLSTYHLYSPKYTTDAILNRDFSKFQQDNISIISLSLYWYRLEGNTQGSYNGTLPDGSIYGDIFLDNVKHVISTANQYGIKVIATVQTLWDDDSTWCTPDYVIDPASGKNIGLAIVRSPEMKQAFIDMINHTVTYLSDAQGIWAWGILNEPWYWGRTPTEHDFVTSNGQTQKENFLTLFKDLSNTVKMVDERPVTIKFCNTKTYIGSDGAPKIKNIFTDDWGMDNRLFNAVDFVSFNVYMPDYPQLEETWQNMTITNINESNYHGKTVSISEFGYNTNDSNIQAAHMEKSIQFYKTLQVTSYSAWFWEGDNNVPNTFGYGRTGYNLCEDAQTGDTRSAYEILINK